MIFLIKTFISHWIYALFSWKLEWMIQKRTIIVYTVVATQFKFYYIEWYQTLFFPNRLFLIPVSSSWQNFWWNLWNVTYFLHLLNFRIVHLIVFEILDETLEIERVRLIFGLIVHKLSCVKQSSCNRKGYHFSRCHKRSNFISLRHKYWLFR